MPDLFTPHHPCHNKSRLSLQRVRRSSSDGHVEVLLCRSPGTSTAEASSLDECIPPTENGGAAAGVAGAGRMGDAEQGPSCSEQQPANPTSGTDHEACIAELPADLSHEIQRHGAELRKVRAVLLRGM